MNYPPFYIGQKIVALRETQMWKKGDTFNVVSMFPKYCPVCNKDTWMINIGNGYEGYCHTCFVPMQKIFQAITYTKVFEEELVSVN